MTQSVYGMCSTTTVSLWILSSTRETRKITSLPALYYSVSGQWMRGKKTVWKQTGSLQQRGEILQKSSSTSKNGKAVPSEIIVLSQQNGTTGSVLMACNIKLNSGLFFSTPSIKLPLYKTGLTKFLLLQCPEAVSLLKWSTWRGTLLAVAVSRH